MEDELWYMKHCSQELQEFRAFIDSFWTDEASKDINLRYLNPHQDDDRKMNVSLSQQDQALREAEKNLETASEHAQAAGELSLQALQQMEYTEEDIQVAYEHHEQFRSNNSLAVSLLPKITKLVNQANAACEGVPRS